MMWDADAECPWEDDGPGESVDRVRERRLAFAAQFDRAKVDALCGCWCRTERMGWCVICGLVADQVPPASSGRTSLAFGGNTPDGE